MSHGNRIKSLCFEETNELVFCRDLCKSKRLFVPTFRTSMLCNSEDFFMQILLDKTHPLHRTLQRDSEMSSFVEW